jgi:hypothetical protein
MIVTRRNLMMAVLGVFAATQRLGAIVEEPIS